MKKSNLSDEVCPLARAAEAVADWWSLLIVREALTGARRFGEFAANIGVAKNILTDRLKKLVAHGVFDVVPASDGSAYSEYAITAKGRDLFYVLVALRQWADRWDLGTCRETLELVDLKNREPVKPLELRASDGRVIGLRDVTIERRKRRTARAS